MSREDVTFTSRGQLCAGWFYRADVEGRAPVVVMAHGLAAVKEMRLDAYAERFAAAGFHVLVFDYRHFGDSEGSPRQLLDIKKQHQDWTAAVTYARTRPDVDGTRVALWGSSLSGGHVLALGHQFGEYALGRRVLATGHQHTRMSQTRPGRCREVENGLVKGIGLVELTLFKPDFRTHSHEVDAIGGMT